MEMSDKVLAALEVLTDAAENDFELYRICNLVRDLIAPPKVAQIDENHATFNGKIYNKNQDGYYISKRYDAAHIAAFKYCCGDIPDGYEIHHKDENRDNNDVSNFQILTRSEHARLHAVKKFSKEIRTCPICGKEFEVDKESKAQCCSESCTHKLPYFKRTGKTVATRTKICVVCGKPFEVSTAHNDHKKRGRLTCSPECMHQRRIDINRAIAEKKRKLKIKICEVCGKEFYSSHKEQRTCSQKCGAKLHSTDEIVTVKCLNCGKEFQAKKSANRKFCGLSCTAKYTHRRKKKDCAKV